MLILCKSFLQNEIKSVKRHFSQKQILNAARKAKNGLGEVLGGMSIEDGEIRKIYITGKNNTGRIVFLILIKNGFFVPVLLRTKKDKIGSNMTNKNQNFVDVLKKSIVQIKMDLSNNDFEIQSIQ